MMATTLGELSRAGRHHLDAADLARTGQAAAGSIPAAVPELHRLIQTMAGCAADLASRDSVDPLASRAELDALTLAAADARDAFRFAAFQLRPEAVGYTRVRAPYAGHTVASLAGAAAALGAGRDLLHTHSTTDPQGVPVQRSHWCDIIASAEVTAAFLGELAGWARQLMPLARWMSAAGEKQNVPVAAREGLDAAARWLWAGMQAARRAQKAHPQRETGRRLLYAIPGYVVPARRPAAAPEPVADLCQGIAVSAERLRVLTYSWPARESWSPAATKAAWRSTAAAAAAAGHSSEAVMRSVADRADELGCAPEACGLLRVAADATAGAWQAWRKIITEWANITTDAPHGTSPAATETSDLLIRMGRLAWANPTWTPASREATSPRDPASLLRDGVEVETAVTAVHHAWDALAMVASADLAAVGAAAGAGRLYVPARSLPGQPEVRYKFERALAQEVDSLLGTYQAAVEASEAAVEALDAAAVALDAPSSLLALAHEVTRERRRAARPRESAPRLARPEPETQPRRPALPGPVERKLRRLGPVDPDLLQRAEAIDKAGEDLLADAMAGLQGGAGAGNAEQEHEPNPRPAESSATVLAAKAFPHGPTAGQASGRTGSGASSSVVHGHDQRRPTVGSP